MTGELDRGPRARPRPGERRSGISLLVVLATLGVIAVLAAVVIPAVFTRGSLTVDNAARILVRDMRAAQNWAAYHGHDVTFLIEASGDGYHVVDHNGEVIVRKDPPGRFERRFSIDGVFEGVTLSEVDLGPKRAVTFDAQGRISRSGSVRVNFRDGHRRVTVSEKTGLVAIEDEPGENGTRR